MLNEDKIKLMTDISFYEKKVRKSVFPADKYFKKDYVSRNMIVSFFRYTLGYILLMVLEILYSMKTIVEHVQALDVLGLFKGYILFYAVGLIIYEVITWYVCNKRHERAKQSQNVYVSKLRRLQKRYEFQTKTKELSKEELEND
ncbi:hypothetical protein C7122_01555 [Lachnospiraceae bacterium oral taxon 096]|jgi:hypothetical protein|nr:hypothetical protein [Lachnospiraceae bacterium]MBS4937223.1 hypothetical protein [Lachnospiraceae bacterium]PTL28617.1 hypothetical protein C7122_01555 [Lachnospiraceae bacterium oral taxon 096]QUI96015.1 hypothetical protein J5A74_01235 [Lachnospiraceae bacterium oral taxon 096]RKW31739.1 MAG: hypothetical protein D8B43_06375 [Lachnoanaerobaculum sp.]